MLEALVTTVVLAAACSAVSITITKAVVFKRPRDWIESKSEFIGELFHCPYCFSHWLALGAVAFYQPRLVVSGFVLADLAVTMFLMVTLASMFSGKILKAFSEEYVD